MHLSPKFLRRWFCCCWFIVYCCSHCLWGFCVWSLFCFFVWFDSLRPISNLSVIKGRVFLGWTITKLGLMFLLKDTTQWRRWGSNPRVKHSTTEQLRSPCFVVQYLVSFIVLQSSWWGKESWLLYFNHLADVLWLFFLTVLWVGLQCVIVVFPDHARHCLGGSVLYNPSYMTSCKQDLHN